MIISILGTAGKNKTTAYYNSNILNKKSGNYYNSTHFLLKNYDNKFIFVGTEYAINFQKEILGKELTSKDIIFKKVSDNDLDEVFEVIFEILEHSNERVLLDITHGFRHQPIMAIFASSLSKFLDSKDIDIIFAKEVVNQKEYEYVYLDDYLEITHISMLLSGFIRTFNFIPIKNLKLIDTKVFENFSKALLSNDIKGVKKWYKKLQNELQIIKNNPELKYLLPLIAKIDKALKPLKNFNKIPIYSQYIELSKITLEKNYLIIALAYSFESLREYCSNRFEPLLISKNIRFKSSYVKNMDVMATISNFIPNNKPNKIQQRYPNIYFKNKNIFKRIDNIYQELRVLRNDLAHINQTKEFSDIKQDISKLNFKIESIYKDDILKNIRV